MIEINKDLFIGTLSVLIILIWIAYLFSDDFTTAKGMVGTCLFFVIVASVVLAYNVIANLNIV